MPATIATALPAIAFGKNQLNLVIASDDYLSADPVIAVNFYQFTAAIAAGFEIPLGWTGGGVIMTAADAPDNSGNQFPTGDGSWAYVQSLIPFFKGNFILDQAFAITGDNSGAHPKLVFTARESGADYNFALTDDGEAGVTTAGVTSSLQPNFAHHVEAWIARADGSAYDQAFTANIPLDDPETGASTVDIHEALHAYLASDVPELAAPYSICANSVRAYFAKFAQFYGPTPTPAVQKLSYGPTNYIVKGGLGMQPALVRDIVSEFTTAGHPELTRFMRQGSINKLVSPQQPEWLSYINLTGAEQVVSPVVMIYNTDGSSFFFNIVGPFAIEPCQKVQFQTGFNQLDIGGRQVGKTPIYYTVQLISGGNPASLAYTYVVDNQYRPWPRYFVYENSYGAFQTIGTVGKGLAEYDRLADEAQLSVPLNTAAIDGEFLECNIFIQEKFTVSIGYDRSGRRNTQLLRDFLLSHTKYVFDEPSGKLIPIIIPDTKNLKDAADGIYAYAGSFQYQYAYQDEVWTEDVPNEADDAVDQLLSEAGVAVAYLPPVEGGGVGYIIVNEGDEAISADGDGNFKYTNAALVGLTGYPIYASQLPGMIVPPDITYDESGGSFTVLVPDFAIVAGYPLYVFNNPIPI